MLNVDDAQITDLLGTCAKALGLNLTLLPYEAFEAREPEFRNLTPRHLWATGFAIAAPRHVVLADDYSAASLHIAVHEMCHALFPEIQDDGEFAFLELAVFARLGCRHPNDTTWRSAWRCLAPVCLHTARQIGLLTDADIQAVHAADRYHEEEVFLPTTPLSEVLCRPVPT